MSINDTFRDFWGASRYDCEQTHDACCFVCPNKNRVFPKANASSMTYKDDMDFKHQVYFASTHGSLKVIQKLFDDTNKDPVVCTNCSQRRLEACNNQRSCRRDRSSKQASTKRLLNTTRHRARFCVVLQNTARPKSPSALFD